MLPIIVISNNEHHIIHWAEEMEGQGLLPPCVSLRTELIGGG